MTKVSASLSGHLGPESHYFLGKTYLPKPDTCLTLRNVTWKKALGQVIEASGWLTSTLFWAAGVDRLKDMDSAWLSASRKCKIESVLFAVDVLRIRNTNELDHIHI